MGFVLISLPDQLNATPRTEVTICQDAVQKPRQSQRINELDWQDTVCLEHADRVARIMRLAAELNLREQPTFSQYLVDRTSLPRVFRTDVPLLRIVFPEHSFFDTASSAIRPEALTALSLIAASLRREVPDVSVFVAGHTDSRGTESYNDSLSIERADAVAARLNQFGVGGIALWRVGFGEAAPLLPNDSPENMAVNRRVEFIIGARAEAVATWLSRQRRNFCADQGAGSQCRQEAPVRIFEAVPVTQRLGLANPPRTRLLLPASRGAQISERRQQREVVGNIGGSGARMAAPPRTRIVIDLRAEMNRIETLDPL